MPFEILKIKAARSWEVILLLNLELYTQQHPVSSRDGCPVLIQICFHLGFGDLQYLGEGGGWGVRELLFGFFC